MKWLIVVALLASAAHADPATQAKADKLFEQAQVDYQAGKYAEAIPLFQQAYELVHDPVYLFNIAQTYRKVLDCEGATTYYKRYLDEAPKAEKPDDNPDLSKKGAQAAAGRRCASCHTDSYAGTKAVARIAGQREEYLVKALRDYKSGVRSGGAMAAMADVAYPLSEEEIEALAHYLANL